MEFFIAGVVFFIAMLLTLAFTVFLYICLVIAVKNEREVSKRMYKIGHALKGRGTDIYEDVTDKYAMNEVNAYIIGVLTASVVVYFAFYGKYPPYDPIKFWLYAEFLIILVVRVVIDFGTLLLMFIFPVITKTKFDFKFSSAANAVMGMMLMSAVSCMIILHIIGMPAKAPIVAVGDYKLVVGHTIANDLISNGFTFTGKTADDVIVNKRDSHILYGETVELVKNGKGYGYVKLTPRYEDEAKLKNCVITYFGISSKSESFSDIKICDKKISQLSRSDFEKTNMRDIFSLSPINCEESTGYERFSLRMQTYPYILWKRYTIEVTYFDEGCSNQFEVFAQHTLWE